MNSRILSPFLVSFLLVAAPAPRAGATELAPGAERVAKQDAVLADLARQLLTRWQLEGELQLESYRPLALSGEGVVLQILEAPSVPASSFFVRVRVQCGAAQPAEQTWTLKAQLLRDVWVAKAQLDRAASLDFTNLETRRVDTLRERETILAGEVLRDYVVARPIQTGRSITWRDIAKRSLVRKGQLIEVAAVDGTLTVTMRALAMENGAEGDIVRVRNLESRKEFNALVVADARAQVRF